MIAPSAKLSSGHTAPRNKRRHGQHAMIIAPEQPARHPFTAAARSKLDSPATIGHLGTGHGAGRRTGSTPVASNAGP